MDRILYTLSENISDGKNDGWIWRRQDMDHFLVQAGIKVNFSEFILIFFFYERQQYWDSSLA